MVRVVGKPRRRARKSRPRKTKRRSKPKAKRRKPMAKNTKSVEPTEVLPVEPPPDVPANPLPFRPDPVHAKRTFDSPWENVPITTGDANATFYAIIFDNDMMLSLGGWQSYGDHCPACGRHKHKVKPEVEPET